ncbi:MAG TPA: DUF378 domain-containing protein [Thermoanaerobaculia bacterium]|nr:DUF378 domain-containing protein [Thermoanaerobaculia bacterium]
MRTFDIVAAVLLVVGGLNWGLVGFLNFDLVAALFGAGSSLTRSVYGLVGIAAIYQIVTIRAIQRRWGVVTA